MSAVRTLLQGADSIRVLEVSGGPAAIRPCATRSGLVDDSRDDRYRRLLATQLALGKQGLGARYQLAKRLRTSVGGNDDTDVYAGLKVHDDPKAPACQLIRIRYSCAPASGQRHYGCAPPGRPCTDTVNGPE